MSTDLILPVILFVVFFGCALLIIFALPSRGDKKFQERLEVVREGFADPGSELLIRQRHLRDLNPAERVLEELPGMERLAILSDQAGVPVPGYQTVLKMLVVGAAFGALVWFFGRPLLAVLAAAAGAAAFLVDQNIAHDTVHPAVEPCSLLPLVAAGQRTFDRHLAQIVAIGRRTRKPGREPPQARQQRKDLLFERLVQLSCLSVDETDGPARFIHA